VSLNSWLESNKEKEKFRVPRQALEYYPMCVLGAVSVFLEPFLSMYRQKRKDTSDSEGTRVVSRSVVCRSTDEWCTALIDSRILGRVFDIFGGCLGFGIWDLGFGVWGVGFGGWGLGFGVWRLGVGAYGPPRSHLRPSFPPPLVSPSDWFMV